MSGPAAGAQHVPVLVDRVRELLRPALAGRAAVVVDATLGLGGHAEALLAEHPQLTLVGLDRDPAALAVAARRLAAHTARVRFTHAVHDKFPVVLDRLGVPAVDAVLFDLGVSSMQLDLLDRGFSYSREAPLDMRMDPTSGVSAADVVNDYSAAELTRVLRVYGEERFADRIARAIVRHRAGHRITSSTELAGLVRDAIPAATRRTGGNPAKRTFQALRIEVNAEIEPLPRVMEAAVDALLPHGRIVVLSYHSLEDRIVKRVLTERARDHTPPGLPVPLPGHGPTLTLLTRGAEVPSPEEVAANPRAASAKLRAAERVPGGAA